MAAPEWHAAWGVGLGRGCGVSFYGVDCGVRFARLRRRAPQQPAQQPALALRAHLQIA